jgi:predicted hotdog family 3-hydroxylacyl-ACP dehydratase
MMDLPVNADMLIPHEIPMRVVNRLLESDGTAGQTEAIFSNESPFVDAEGKIDRLMLLELIAQSYASARGYEDISDGNEVSKGFLVGVSKVIFHGDAHANETLLVKIRTEEIFDSFYIASGKVFQGELLVLEAMLKIWLDSDSEQ